MIPKIWCQTSWYAMLWYMIYMILDPALKSYHPGPQTIPQAPDTSSWCRSQHSLTSGRFCKMSSSRGGDMGGSQAMQRGKLPLLANIFHWWFNNWGDEYPTKILYVKDTVAWCSGVEAFRTNKGINGYPETSKTNTLHQSWAVSETPSKLKVVDLYVVTTIVGNK